MNWRKPVILGLLRLTGSEIPEMLKFIKSIEYKSKEEIKAVQMDKLKTLLLHAHKNVPYYNKKLEESGVVINGTINLDNFNKIPLLTKEIIRKEGKDLISRDSDRRKTYKNTSGGSTGEPVEFIQDKHYDEWNIATKIFFNQMLGKEPGEKEIKFWGSDRDIIMGNLTLKDRLMNYLYNRKFFNSYDLNEKSIEELIKLNNKFKPLCYWSYVEGAFEFSKVVNNKMVKLFSPKFIITTIGPLYDNIINEIENAFKCPVYNQYGSREVGAIACQCKEQKHLHTFPWFNIVEVLDENNRNVEPGEEGKIIVTNLANYSMPLIRYDIGDVAIPARDIRCGCGRNFYSFENVIGRTLGYFKKRDGSLAHSHFIVQSIFFKNWIKRFQIIQEDYDLILVNIEPQAHINTTEHGNDITEIEERIKLIMGRDAIVKIKFVNLIKPTSSGKYLYTVSRVK